MSKATTVEAPVEIKSDLRKFNKAEQQVTLALAALGKYTVITTPEESTTAMDEMKKAKEVEKIIETKRTELVKPYNDEVKRINTFAKELTAKIPPEVDRVKAVVLAFTKEQERLAKEKRDNDRKASLLSLGMVYNETEKLYAYEKEYVDDFTILHVDDVIWSEKYTYLVDKIQQLRTQSLQAKKDEMELTEAFGSEEEVTSLAEEIKAIESTPVVETMPMPSSGPAFKPKGLTKRWVHEVVDINLVPREWLMIDEAKVKQAIKDGTRSIPGLKIYQDESITLR